MFGDVSLVAVYVAVLLLLTAASTHRMAGAVLGIGGNSKQEAMYPVYAIDAGGQKLDGANRYTVRFTPGQLPPVNAFWSLTMYDLPGEPARRQSDQPLLAQLAHAVAVREGRRWRADLLCPERDAGQGQGAELVTHAQRSLLHCHASLLAKASSARRHVEQPPMTKKP
jgi:hypothetical protein